MSYSFHLQAILQVVQWETPKVIAQGLNLHFSESHVTSVCHSALYQARKLNSSGVDCHLRVKHTVHGRAAKSGKAFLVAPSSNYLGKVTKSTPKSIKISRTVWTRWISSKCEELRKIVRIWNLWTSNFHTSILANCLHNLHRKTCKNSLQVTIICTLRSAMSTGGRQCFNHFYHSVLFIHVDCLQFLSPTHQQCDCTQWHSHRSVGLTLVLQSLGHRDAILEQLSWFSSWFHTSYIISLGKHAHVISYQRKIKEVWLENFRKKRTLVYHDHSGGGTAKGWCAQTRFRQRTAWW